MCNSLGLPLHPDKCLGPSSVLVVLGIELDSNEQVARLPADKFVALQQLITSWLSCHWCTKNQLESLIGHLHHATKMVWSGRTFLRRMINLLCCFRRASAKILSSSWTYSGGTSSSLLRVGFVFGFFPGMSATPDL